MLIYCADSLVPSQPESLHVSGRRGSKYFIRERLRGVRHCTQLSQASAVRFCSTGCALKAPEHLGCGYLDKHICKRTTVSEHSTVFFLMARSSHAECSPSNTQERASARTHANCHAPPTPPKKDTRPHMYTHARSRA